MASVLECTLNDHGIAVLAMNDVPRRNALGLAMFDALEEAVAHLRADDRPRVVLLTGRGPAFCAGFDLGAANDDPTLMRMFIERLSRLNRALRSLPVPVVAGVCGAAIAGGCALLSACDVVIAETTATFGYPVHAIGVSPAVTLPTLVAAVGAGATRALVLSGHLIDGREARRIGLVTHLVEPSNPESLDEFARAFTHMLAVKPPGAVRATKAWLNELDGTGDESLFIRTAEASAALTSEPEAIAMLRAVWAARMSTPRRP